MLASSDESDAHIQESDEPEDMQKLHDHQESRLKPDQRLEVTQVRWIVNFCEDNVDAPWQDVESSVGPKSHQGYIEQESHLLPLHLKEHATKIAWDVCDVVKPSQEDANAHNVSKEEAWIKSDSTQVVQEHLTPVVVSWHEKMADKVLDMVPIGDEDVTVNTRRCFTKDQIIAISEVALRMLTT